MVKGFISVCRLLKSCQHIFILQLITILMTAYAGATCDSWLQTAKLKSFEDWRRAYEISKTENNLIGAAYAFSHMLLHKDSPLKIDRPTKKFLRKNIDVLRFPALVKALSDSEARLPRSWFRIKKERFKARFGLSEFFNFEDPFGREISLSTRIKNTTKDSIRDFLWALGPFFYRLLGTFSNPSSFIHAEQRIKFILPIEKLGIKRDAFFEEMTSEYLRAPELYRRYRERQRGKILRPLLTSFALTFWGLSPGQIAQAKVSLDYPSDLYIQDIQKSGEFSFEQKKVTVIVSTELALVDNQGKPINPFVKEVFNLDGKTFFKSVNDIEKLSSEYHVKAVSNLEQFTDALKSSSDSDVVIIMAHGLPGEMGINGQTLSQYIDQLPPHVLKDGAYLLFFSCSFAGKSTSDDSDPQTETWVKMSRRLFEQSGTAVASTKDIAEKANTFPNMLPPEEQKELRTLIFIFHVFDSFFQALIPNAFGIDLANAIDASILYFNDFYRGKLAVRVYHQESENGPFTYKTVISDGQ